VAIVHKTAKLQWHFGQIAIVFFSGEDGLNPREWGELAGLHHCVNFGTFYAYMIKMKRSRFW
jgi:hypothetical protein